MNGFIVKAYPDAIICFANGLVALDQKFHHNKVKSNLSPFFLWGEYCPIIFYYHPYWYLCVHWCNGI